VVGFEDSSIARQTEPPLTTVHQPVEEMGREMVGLLIARINKSESLDRPYVLLDTHMVARESG
jgi:DNA-binding LacI/PurR family transcriptional regulator